ncbi:right-handed parallel beta-helix repeat-containing protein [Pseudomonas reinekei]|uniref:mannuronan 5-epimerase n=3 Tax=Pseudomonas reinekei TaxID=395598 RepID=A0A6H9RJD2_PSERE|nr:right-handed parallel beta-helix repeat-containing protein [Pseudomonas reinekei]KAB0479779.1 right-handed parallel beta-helix repeat-containing protein [Pseudomonas reinekei]
MKAIVLGFLLAVAGGVQASQMISPNIPRLSTDTISVPAAGLTISDPIYIYGKLKIVGEGPLNITGRGRFVVEENAVLEINGVSIFISGLSEMETADDRTVVLMNGGELRLQDNTVVVDVVYDQEKSRRLAPWDEAPRFWVVASGMSGRKKHASIKVKVKNNKFESKNIYSVGAINLSIKTGAAPLNAKNIINMKIGGEVEGNKFYNFHGVIKFEGGENVLVSDNFLMKNSYFNIAASGNKIAIQDNEIRYPGNGTTGDGITVLGIMVDSEISGNNIYAGSCYGIWINVSHASNVIIKDNLIVNGITSAIYVSNGIVESDKDINGIIIDNNVMTGNSGFAIAIQNGRNIEITNNNFEGNAPGFPAQIMKSDLAEITVSGNISAKKLTPEWAEEHALYRHATYDDNSVLSLQ